ncbi:MAG: hypothetical protein VCG02_09655 [Verrucomicrobiota bacterium]
MGTAPVLAEEINPLPDVGGSRRAARHFDEGSKDTLSRVGTLSTFS